MLQCKNLHIRVFPFAFCIGSCIPFLQKEKRKKKKYYKISVFLIKKINVTSDPLNLFLDFYNTRPLVPASSPRTVDGDPEHWQEVAGKWLPAGFPSLSSARPCPVLFYPHSRQSPVIGWTESPPVGTVVCAGCEQLPEMAPLRMCPPPPFSTSPTHFSVLPATPVSFLGVPCLNSSYRLLPFFLSLGFRVLTIPTAFFLLKFSLPSQKRRAELLRADSSAACGLFSPFRFWRPPGPGGLWDLAAWSQCPCLAGKVSKDCSCNPWAEIWLPPKCPLTFTSSPWVPPLSQWGNQEGLAGRDKVSSRRVRGWASRFGFLHHRLVSGLSLNKTAPTDAVTECLAHGHRGGHRQAEVITRG